MGEMAIMKSDSDREEKGSFFFHRIDFFPEYRWKIELFFKWIKQHLKIKSFWSASENAVKTQIYIAIITYTVVAIIKAKLKLK